MQTVSQYVCSIHGPFLKERVPESVEELVRLAKQYMEANGGTITGKATKSFQKQKTECKTDISDKKANKLAGKEVLPMLQNQTYSKGV